MGFFGFINVVFVSLQNDLIIEMPRKRQQTRRFGGQEMNLDNISDLDSSDSEAAELAEEMGLQTRAANKRAKGKSEHLHSSFESHFTRSPHMCCKICRDDLFPWAVRVRFFTDTRSSRKSRRNQEDYDFSIGEDDDGRYNRSDCFKVEKMLLVYGYGRWEDILAHARFKKKLDVADVELIAKSVVSMARL